MKDTARIVGYVRVSTNEQTFDLQTQALEKAGVNIERDLFSDVISGSKMKRKGLSYAMRHLRDGDTLMVWKLDRLGRSLSGVIETIAEIEAMGVRIVSVTENIDTRSPMGRAMMQIILVFAEMERNIIAERTKAGMAAKKAKNPKWKPGRPHGVLDYPKRVERFHDLYDADFLDANGDKMTLREICDELKKADPRAFMGKTTNWFSNWKSKDFEGFEPRKDEKLDLKND